MLFLTSQPYIIGKRKSQNPKILDDHGLWLFFDFAEKIDTFLLCKLQIGGKHKKNMKGDYDYAAPLTAPYPHGLSGDRRRSAAKHHVGLNDPGTGRERITKDNQNLNTNNIIEILLAAAAALLCAAIDHFTKEKENDD